MIQNQLRVKLHKNQLNLKSAHNLRSNIKVDRNLIDIKIVHFFCFKLSNILTIFLKIECNYQKLLLLEELLSTVKMDTVTQAQELRLVCIT